MRNPVNRRNLPSTAPLGHEMDFVPRSVHLQAKFWAETILNDHLDKNRLIGWTQGVRLHELVDAEATGLFQGRHYRVPNLTPTELPNLIPQEFEDWALVDPCLPLRLEPKKPRLF